MAVDPIRGEVLPSVETVATVIAAVGIPVLIALFYAEGLLVGKILQPAGVFIVYVAAARPDDVVLGGIIALCAGAVTVGQLTVYRGFHPEAQALGGVVGHVPILATIPGSIRGRIGDERLETVQRLFDRYGGIGVGLAAFVPGVRCLIAIPAGMSRYSAGRFVAATFLGNIVYLGVLVAIAYGLVGLYVYAV